MKTRSPKQRSKWKLLRMPGPGEGRVIGQVRYSSLMQDKRSIAEQMENIRQRTEAHGWELVGWCEEPATSAQYDELERRPEFMDLLTKRAGASCNVIMCDETSRWSRSDVGNVALKMLRERNCWWETADGAWDINKPLSDGGATLWAITTSENADFLRKLSYHVTKGKRAKAREGYSNGNPMFGYRMPVVHYMPELGHMDDVRRRRIIYEPHPDYFSGLVRLGELLAQEPPVTFVQIAYELNVSGYRYWSYKYGERAWSPQIIEGILYRAYPREYRPGSGRGTIVSPDGSFTEGLHQCAWSYELCLKIDQNRALLAQNISARPRKGNIHTFAGIAYCAHCKTPLTIHPSRSQAKARPGQSDQTKVYSYVYYECDSLYKYGTPCKGSSTKRWMSIRADILEYQFGVLLGWLGEWSDDVEAQLQALYVSEDGHDADPSAEYERHRQELAKRKDNVSRQHEMGYLNDEQLAQRMAVIIKEEAQIPIPLQRRRNTPQETLGLIRSLGTQWLDADRPQRRVLRYQLVNALADRVYVDLDRLSIVGIQFAPDVYLPAQHMLWHRGWREQTEHPNTLWNPQAQMPDGLPPTNVERVLAALRNGCTTSMAIVQESGVSPRNSVNVLLLRLLREGKVTRERIQREGKEYRYHLAE